MRDELKVTTINKEEGTERVKTRLELIADEMNAAVFEWTKEDGRFYSSSAYENYAISQINADDLLMNRGPKDLVHPEDQETLMNFFNESNSGKNRIEATLRLQMISGDYRWCKMVGLFYRDTDMNLERIVGIIIDINEEHERSFMLDSMINAMPCGVGVFTFADTLLCEYYSDGFTKMAGISREEMDKKIAENTVLSSLIAPIDFPKVAPRLAELSSKGLPMNLTYRYIYNDGSIRWLHLSARKLREEKGYPVYYCVFTNPSRETAQYGDVVENSPTGVFVAEKDTRKTIFANKAAALMFGFKDGHVHNNRTIEETLSENNRKPLMTREQIDTLTTDKYTEFNISQDDKYYNIQAKEIIWNGVVSYIVYFTDKTNEQTLLSSIPGGVAIYRIKKDGRIATDYVSEGLAAMSGYTVTEFLELLRHDACVNIVAEDIPKVTKKMKEALKENHSINAMYRIYTKTNDEILIRLDANMMPTKKLEEDDIAAFYAVHTVVSDESKNIMDQQKQLYELINTVPTGIGIYEIIDGKINQTYMNDAFYSMLDSSREKRAKYLNQKAMNSTHPDDIEVVNEAIKSLIDGKNYISLSYRIKKDDGKWFWTNLSCSVIERRENYIKLYGASSDYNDVMEAQENNRYIRKTLEIALQSAGVLAWRYDYRTKCIVDSGTLGEAYNLPRIVENVPQTIVDMGFIADESKADFFEMFKQIENEESVSGDLKAVAIDGTNQAWFRQIYTPVFDEKGRYIDSVGIAIDITEQKNKEIQYEEQQRLNKIAATNALSTVSLNLSQNTIIDFSSNIPELDSKRIFNSADEILESINQDKQVDPNELHNFEVVSSAKNMIKTFESGQSHIEIVFHYFKNRRWLKANYDMLKNPYTGDIEAITSIYDVTNNVRAQKVISQLTELDYQSLILIDADTGKAVPYQLGHNDSNMDALVALQLEQGNGEAGFEGFMRKYAYPGTADKAIHDNNLHYVKEQLQKFSCYECMHSLLLDEKTEHYRVLYTYLKDDKSLILSAVQRVTEIYDREIKQKEELSAALSAAESANKAKTAFLSRVSHDMRTPLNGILGLTNLMKDLATDSKLSRDLQELELSGKYLLELINDTLDVSRIENGKLELHPTVCDSRVCFNNVQNLINPSLKEKNIQFELEADNLPFTYLFVDEGRLQQIAMNILGNAIKFTPEGGRIHCLAETLSMENGIVTDHFVIEDNGCGMDEEFLPHLFEAFSQENASNTNSKQGTGLGMSITKSLVELMDGEINVTSKRGVGTCVDIILKLAIATNEQVEKWRNSLDNHANDYNLHGKRILLCEDHPLNTKIAKRLLKKKGMIVDHAENGRIGVDLFVNSEKNYYDAILMDIRMPEMDGIDATKTIRSLNRTDAKSIPIIAMTANAFDDDVRLTREAGMNAHLSKPIEPERLYGELEKLVNPKHQYIRKRVLIVDDIEMNRAFIAKPLRDTYEIFEAENGQQALEMLEKYHGMDVVVTDIQMPGMNGDELIRKIRENDNYRHMVIIANTQYEGPGQEERLLALGANEFIYKAAKPEIIRIRIKNALHAMN